MKKLVVSVKPFTFTQTVLVVEDNEVVDTKTVPMNTFEESVLAIANELEINELNLVGVKVYTRGIQKKIEKAELKKYNENKLNIILM